MVTVETARH